MALLLVARASVRGSQVATRNSGSFPPYYAGARPLSARDQSVARFLLHLTTRIYACDQTLPFCEGAGPQTSEYCSFFADFLNSWAVVDFSSGKRR